MTNKWGHILGRAVRDEWRTHASVSESGGHVHPSCTRPPASHLRPSRTRTPASCRQSCCWLRRLCSSTRSPSCSRYCRSAPRARHCYTSRATPAMLLTALPEVACRAVLRLPVGVLDAAQGRGAAAFNRRRGKKGNGDGRNRERRRRGLSVTEEAVPVRIRVCQWVHIRKRCRKWHERRRHEIIMANLQIGEL